MSTNDCPTITRRAFLQVLGLGYARWLRPLSSGLTSVADEIALLLRWWCDRRDFRLVPC